MLVRELRKSVLMSLSSYHSTSSISTTSHDMPCRSHLLHANDTFPFHFMLFLFLLFIILFKFFSNYTMFSFDDARLHRIFQQWVYSTISLRFDTFLTISQSTPTLSSGQVQTFGINSSLECFMYCHLFFSFGIHLFHFSRLIFKNS